MTMHARKGFEVACRAAARTVLLALLSASGAVAQIAESPGFALAQDTLSGLGQQGASSSFVLSASVGQESVTGLAASGTYRLESGFWTSATITREVRLAASGSGSGILTGPVFDCVATAGAISGDCAERTGHGNDVSAVAQPSADTFFTGWSGCDVLTSGALPDDTCGITVTRDVEATADFVRAAGVLGRVWLDYDGNGIIDAGEPGYAGAVLTLDELAGPVDSASTDPSGGYGFPRVFPGAYSVSLDPASLPGGVVPTFDPDGVQTPYVTGLTLAAGEVTDEVLFGIQPLADLDITVVAVSLSDIDLRFDVTVTNLGGADATAVVVDTTFSTAPAASTIGCGEDPAGTPRCSLGDLAAQASRSFSILARGQAGQAQQLGVAVDVSALEADPDPSNNTASAVGFVTFPVPALGVPGMLVLLLVLLTTIVLRARRPAASAGH